jgi:hypothetical protein
MLIIIIHKYFRSLGGNLLYINTINNLLFRFSLQSIISYIGDSNVKNMGQYVTHCKRLKGYWEIHNNLVKKRTIYKCTKSKYVKPHILFYIKISD